jgi:hypothetical protein
VVADSVTVHPTRDDAQKPEATVTDEPRSRTRRRRDTESRLARDIDVWVASASPEGAPYLVPLSFDWDGESLLVSTPADSPTGRNLAAGGRARVGLGATRDVTMVDGTVTVLEIDELGDAEADRFAARTGFDPRQEAGTYRWFRISPRRVQAWREADELAGRDLMRNGRWLVDAADDETGPFDPTTSTMETP